MTIQTLEQATVSGETLDEARWNAVIERQRDPQPRFYYAVHTTGVYCKPSCASRRPNRANVSFFDTTEAADAAGFRPCRRCQPQLDQEEVTAAMHRAREIIETLDHEPSLQELSAMVGYSTTYFQRLFKQTFGVSPKQYARAHRINQLKQRLKTQATVTEAFYDVGYNSSHGFYSLTNVNLGMHPTTYRKGGLNMTISYTIVESPLGSVLVAATERGICAVRVGDAAALVQELESEFPSADIQRSDALLAAQAAQILSYLAGQQAELNLPIDVQATAFQARVWSALRSIPYGQVRSYKQVAETLGDAKGARAVARACATNPVAFIIPCHRVVGSDGALSGYRWGLALKKTLLEQEQEHAAQGA